MVDGHHNTVMLYEVIARYVFDAATVWGMELAVLLFAPLLLGGPVPARLKGHVALDVARQRLSPAWQQQLDLVNFPIIVPVLRHSAAASACLRPTARLVSRRPASRLEPADTGP